MMDIPTANTGSRPRSPRGEKALGTLVLLVWLQLLPGMYPLPSQRTAEFAAMAHETKQSDAYFESRGIDTSDVVPKRTEQQLAEDLQAAYWGMWVETAFFAVVGTLAAVMTYRGTRYWKLAVLLTSGFTAYVSIKPIVLDIAEKGFSHWLKVWEIVIVDMVREGETSSAVSSAYHLFIWPSYHVLLVLVVVALWMLQKRRFRASGDDLA